VLTRISRACPRILQQRFKTTITGR
jgi:hypothetical protein